MSDPGQPLYRDDEAEEILRIAASISAPPGAIDRARLIATAAELGISPEAVEIAERKHAEQKLDRELRREFDTGQVMEFKAHFVSFLIVNLFLVGINFATGLHEFWAIYPILAWGMGLAFHAFAVYGKFGGGNAGAFERWRERKLNPDEAGNEYDHSGYCGRPNVVIGIHAVKAERRRLKRQYRKGFRDSGE